MPTTAVARRLVWIVVLTTALAAPLHALAMMRGVLGLAGAPIAVADTAFGHDHAAPAGHAAHHHDGSDGGALAVHCGAGACSYGITTLEPPTGWQRAHLGLARVSRSSGTPAHERHYPPYRPPQRG